MVTRLRNINAVQFGIVYGAVCAVIGFVIAVLMLPFYGAMSAMGGGRGIFPGMGIGSVIIFPVMYFIIGFIGGAITALVYNIVAGWTGGVEVTLDTAVPAESRPAAGGYTT